MTFEDAVNKTAESIEKRRCLPFIGAGVSAWAGWPYPNSEQCMRMVENSRGMESSPPTRLEVAIERAKQAAGDVLTISPETLANAVGAPPTWFLRLVLLILLPSRLFKTYGDCELSTVAGALYLSEPHRLANVLTYFFADGRTAAKPNDLHQVLALMPFERIITTNYDGLIESAHQAIAADIDVVADDKEFLNTGHIRPQLFKIHGDFGPQKLPEFNDSEMAQEALNRLVLTDAQYWNFPGPPGSGLVNDLMHQGVPRTVMVERIRTMMLTHRVLFLGYSLSDFNVIELFHGLSGFQHKKEKPLLVTSEPFNPAKVGVWRGRNFDVVSCGLRKFIDAVWEKLYGQLDPITLTTPSLSRLSSDARYEIPILILLRHATQNPPFKDKLRQITQHSYFPATLFNGEPTAFKERLAAFATVGWLRRVNVGEEAAEVDGVFYQFVAEIRERLRHHIKKQ